MVSTPTQHLRTLTALATQLVKLETIPTVDIVPVGAERMAQSIREAVDAGVEILYFPLGYYLDPLQKLPQYLQSLRLAVQDAVQKGVIVIASAGNSRSQPSVRAFPASLDEVIAVGATDRDDQLTNVSSFGDWVTIYSPSLLIEVKESDGTVVQRPGETLAAAAVVTGIVALMLAVNPDLEPQAVKSALIRTAVDISAKNVGLSSVRHRVDALAAVTAIPHP